VASLQKQIGSNPSESQLKSLLHQLGQKVDASASSASGKFKTYFQNLSTAVKSVERELSSLKVSVYLTSSQLKAALKGTVTAVGADWAAITALGKCHF
jgi:hypothetical protein